MTAKSGERELELEAMRHSAAHVMAAAVVRLFENVQLDIGPATTDGFYYDFDLPHRIGPEDFPRIEEEMRSLIKANLPFEKLEMSRGEAYAKLKGQKYKIERLSDIPEGEPISFYKCGDFIDLCRGPHLASTGKIGAVKLLSVAGSYYRGLETNPMLQRIYGIAAASDKEIQARLKQIEEAHNRDHRKLGRDLDLFSSHDEIGPGLIVWHPKGALVRSLIEEYWKKAHLRGGYQLLNSPHLGRSLLWETSGHLDFYRESMYAPMAVDGQEYFIKPMNCPFHIMVYKSHPRSYRELPLRWAELGTVYRYEKTGVLHGLLRVRGFTQDDAHIFCTQAQMESEVARALSFAIVILRSFGFAGVRAYLSTRPAKAIGDEADWSAATESLRRALENERIEFKVEEGGGAFYGPKVDLKVSDAIGREWQMSTVQFDFNLPERFDMAYVGEDGRSHRPFMVHRALLGSLERFFGILVEHYAGAFPFWLAPEQARILPITDKELDYADMLAAALRDFPLRIGVDFSSGKIGAKIRQAQVDKIPYMFIVGAREKESGKVSVRARTGGDRGAMTIEELKVLLQGEDNPAAKEK